VAGGLTKAFQRLGLRFPALFVILLVVTLVDLVVPDIIPFVDEIVLAALTALFGLWRERRSPERTSRDPDPSRPA
jgi:Family of unknown function (DUF6116)